MSSLLLGRYVSGFELYETYKPGAVWKLSTASSYTDDNTLACCGADAAVARPDQCGPLPVCSETTSWNAIWTGTPGNSGESATIFTPPVCPYAYRTDILRVDLDTVAAAGWNNYDAAKIKGTIGFPPGLILPNQAASAGQENQVAYMPPVGVHGNDTFQFSVTDCLAYGPSAPVQVALPMPAAAFVAEPYFSVSAVLPTSSATTVSMAVDLDVIQPNTFSSIYTLLDSTTANVHVELKGVSSHRHPTLTQLTPARVRAPCFGACAPTSSALSAPSPSRPTSPMTPSPVEWFACVALTLYQIAPMPRGR
jgi:hypothetical protein